MPVTLHVQRVDGEQSLDWLMVVQEEADGLRLSLFDPLGVPLARQQLNDRGWHNDGLLPPNAEVRQLFAVLVFALTPATHLSQQYPHTSWRISADGSRTFEPDWQVAYDADTIMLGRTQLAQHYTVTPLTQEGQP